MVISFCPKLTTLILNNRITITESMALQIAEKLPNLHTLWECRLISKQAVINLLHPNTKLKSLEINSEITDKSLKLIAKNCKSLRWLMLRNAQVTTEAVRHLLKTSWQLELLRLQFTGISLLDTDIKKEFPFKDIQLIHR
jgi:hypothetical protein